MAMTDLTNFDWDSFWINIWAGLIYFVLGIFFSIWLIPRFTLRLIRKRNKTFLKRKLASIIRELCEYIFCSPFKDNELNHEIVSIFTNNRERFVNLCIVNVFNKISYPKMSLVIYEYFKALKPEDSYSELSKEHDRLKNFRTEIEKILAVHSHYLDDKITLKISDLCSDIRELELKYIMNLEYNELLEKTNTQRKGIFGVNELPVIYEKILLLIKEISSLNYFEYEITIKK
jgi:hypothetical protein